METENSIQDRLSNQKHRAGASLLLYNSCIPPILQ